MDTTTDSNLTTELRQFTGTEQLTRWSILFRRHVLTDGALYLAKKAGAFWLMDIVGSVQHLARLKAEDLQTWRILVFDGRLPVPAEFRGEGEISESPNGGAVVWATGRSGETIYQQWVPYTDFPLGTFKGNVKEDAFLLYAGKNELGGYTILLPGEY
jgi:hypothetical protein